MSDPEPPDAFDEDDMAMMEGNCTWCNGDGEICCSCDDRGCSRCIDGMRTCPHCGGSGFLDDDEPFYSSDMIPW
jgi:hypothetical protein